MQNVVCTHASTTARRPHEVGARTRARTVARHYEPVRAVPSEYSTALIVIHRIRVGTSKIRGGDSQFQRLAVGLVHQDRYAAYDVYDARSLTKIEVETFRLAEWFCTPSPGHMRGIEHNLLSDSSVVRRHDHLLRVGPYSLDVTAGDIASTTSTELTMAPHNRRIRVSKLCSMP